MKSTYCEYILEKILSTSEVRPILALIAPSPLSILGLVVRLCGNNDFLSLLRKEHSNR